MAEELVRLDGKIVVEVSARIPRDLYDAWQAGDPDAKSRVDDALDIAVSESTYGETMYGEDVTLEKATLLEDDGYLGTDVMLLKDFR